MCQRLVSGKVSELDAIERKVKSQAVCRELCVPGPPQYALPFSIPREINLSCQEVDSKVG